MSIEAKVHDFFKFLLRKTYVGQDIDVDKYLVIEGFYSCCVDVSYHFKESTEKQVFDSIVNNKSELAIFLYRVGNIFWKTGSGERLTNCVHWLLRECCACEIYFNNKIDIGFYIVHGTGTVLGSRNTIGKGFKIYQGCTVGHKKAGGAGNIIGDDVVMFTNSMILGENKIGNNVIIGANSLVITDVPSSSKCIGSPAKIYKIQAQLHDF